MTVTRFVPNAVAVRVIYACAGTDPLAVDVIGTGVLPPTVAVSVMVYDGPLPVELRM
jgi:hypothetical protein